MLVGSWLELTWADLSSKSQLAIEFVHQVAGGAADKWMFWVHAGTRARVEEGFRTIADAVKLPGRNQPKADILQLVYSWLSNERNGSWVMILDSADDSDVFYGASANTRDGRPLATYLPQSRNGSIIITTRDRDLAFRLTGNYRNMVNVGPMTGEDALMLLEKRLGSLSDVDVAADLVRVLEFIPLAISQAAAYIQARAPRSSLEKYLVEFQESELKRARLLGHDAGDLRRDGGASNSILTTWDISFNHIRSKRPSAADLLSLMSFFNRQGIPEFLLKPSKQTKNAIRASDSEDTEDSGPDSSDGDTESRFEDDVAMLRDYCLITANEEGGVLEMHGLVQLSTRKWLETCGLQETFKHQYIERMAESFPAGDLSHWATCQRLFAHVEAATDYRPVDGNSQEIWATLLFNGAWYARLRGRHDVAERMLRKARRTREKLFGTEDEATLASISLLGLVFLGKGLYSEAEELFVQVMETSKTKLGADHPDTLSSMDHLASTHRNQGRWEEAEKLFVQVMENRKTKLGADHPDTLSSMANLAATYQNQGRWKEAEVLEEQVMETRKRVLGEEHPDTLTSMTNLAFRRARAALGGLKA